MTLKKTDILWNIIAWSVAIIWCLPIIGIIVASLRPSEDIINGWWNLETLRFSLKNYNEVLFYNTIPMWRAVVNSIVISILGTGLPILIGFMAGYSFARHNIPAKKTILIIILILMAIPLQMLIIPVFKIMKSLSLLNNLLSVVIMDTATAIPWIIYFSSNSIRSMNISIEEAAKIDGCNTFSIFFKIVIPNLYPVILSACTLQFVWSWLDLFLPLSFLYDTSNYTSVQVIPLLRGFFVANWGQLSAASVVTIIIPFLVFFKLQKYYLLGATGWSGDK